MSDKTRILVVDDEPDIVKLLKSSLEAEGYEVLTAADGEEGFRMAQTEKPDLIILDLLLPKLNGYEVCTKLKQNSNTSQIPVIFVTSLDEMDEELKGFEVGGVDYITKPVIPELVLARVRTHLKLNEVTEQLAQYSQRMEKMLDNKLDL